MPEFMNPAAFLLLIPVPLFFVFRKLGILKRISFPLTLADWNGEIFKWNDGVRRIADVLSRVLVITGYCAVVLAFADPVIHHEERVYTSRGADIVFVLDTSPSMAARDMADMSRLDAARQAIRTLIRQNSGASVALVSMASEAALVVPPTTDRTAFLDRLDRTMVGELGIGTAIGTGLSTAVYHLVSSSAPKKCIVLITDGENNAGSIHPETAAALAGEHGIALYVLGIGTRGNVPLEYVDPVSGKVYSGYLEPAFDPRPLEQIAEAAGGRYFTVENIASLASALSVIDKHEKVEQTYYLKMTDEYYYDRLILAAAAVLVLAWIIRRLYLGEVI